MRHFCKKNFWDFFLYGFGAGLNPLARRWIVPELHHPLAQWFQKHVDHWFKMKERGVGEKVHLAILVPRRFGKTTMITRAGQLWLHLRDPELSTATGAVDMTLSTNMLAAMKAVIDGSDPHALFTRMYGNWAGNARTWTGKAIVHSARKNTARQDPSMSAFAVETSVVGSHPDAVFYDDPISYKRLETDANWLDAVKSQVDSLFPALEKDALVVWVGTRYDAGDHFGEDFATHGVKSVEGMETEADIKTDPEGKWHLYFLAGRDTEGKPTMSKIWSEKDMDEYKRSNPIEYAAQVLNDPTQSETNPITPSQIRDCFIPVKEVPWSSLRYAITCDTAFVRAKYRPGKDWSVFIVHGYPRNGSGDVYVIECHGSPYWRAEDFGRKLVALVQRYRNQGKTIFAIGDEDEPGGKSGGWKLSLRNMFSDVNEPMPAYYQWNRYTGPKKISRMELAATFWVDGHVRIVEGCPGAEHLTKQLSMIGQYRVNPQLHDDFLDAHADAFMPELYQPMRRQGQLKAPWERGAIPAEMTGLDQRMFEDDEASVWIRDNPRAPLRNL